MKVEGRYGCQYNLSTVEGEGKKDRKGGLIGGTIVVMIVNGRC